jgi:N-methylhydantoinase A
MLRIGIDIGGTFTDVVAFDPQTGRLETLKVSSTPHKPAEAVIQGLQAILTRTGRQPKDVTRLVHGTTVATNAVLEGKWAKTALVTTEGFRDVLEIGRQNRPELYNFFTQRPEPLVPRRWRFEVPERLDYRGRVLRPLDERAVEEIAKRLEREGIESVAVVFLFSYLNPEHERRAREVLKRNFPGPIVLSCETLPEFREYERTSTTVLNAALVPLLNRYLQGLEEGAKQLGIQREWRILQSNGGITGAQQARRMPVTLLLSGPAGGVAGARFLGELASFRNVITLDMGGTSCDVSLIQEGQPRLSSEGEVAGRPLRVPMVDIQTIGAGGGSIAWIDSGGALRVGPQSAGADPGPVCYGRGGTEPTVTDAHLVLGRLNSERPLGDIPRLDIEAARRVLSKKIAKPLGMSLEEAALGILTVAEANMERAIRVLTVERGHDPREFALLAFGGAGPLHAGRLAERLQIPTVIIPQAAGVLSALGLLTADLAHHFVRTVLQGEAALNWELINRIYDEFRQEGQRKLLGDGLAEGQIAFLPSMDLRYRGQSFELSVPVPDRHLSPEDWPQITARFHEEHKRAYGYAAPEEPIEVVNLRLIALGREDKLALPRQDRRAARMKEQEPIPLGQRPVYFAEIGWISCPFYARETLSASTELTGPAVFEGAESTVVLYPGHHARMDAYGNLLIEVK